MRYLNLLDKDESEKKQALEALYGFGITAVKPWQQSYMIFAEDEPLLLISKDDAADTMAQLRRWDYLQAVGLKGLPFLHSTVDGDLGFVLEDQISFIRSLIGGRSGELALKYDRSRFCHLLVELHVHSQKMPPILRPREITVEDVREEYLARQTEMGLFKTMACHRLYPTAFDRVFLNFFEGLEQNMSETLEILTPYSEKANQDLLPTGLLKNGRLGKDFWISDDGHGYWKGLAEAVWGPLIMDLAGFLGNVGFYCRWCESTGQNALTQYDKIRPLNPKELKLAYGIAVFPENVWNAAHKYYKGERNQDELNAVHDLSTARENDLARQEYWKRLLGVEWRT